MSIPSPFWHQGTRETGRSTSGLSRVARTTPASSGRALTAGTPNVAVATRCQATSSYPARRASALIDADHAIPGAVRRPLASAGNRS
jgi:hypothetical protein